MVLYFQFHHSIVTIRSDCQQIIENLQEDFRHFSTSRPSKKSALQFNLINKSIANSFVIKSPFLFQTKMCRVYGWGGTRICDYGEGNMIFAKNSAGKRKFLLVGANTKLLYEMIYSALLSAVGECLDTEGLHRLHALAFTKDGWTGVIPLPSGGGKSSLALLMMQDVRYKVFSDEIPIFRNRQIFPFPIRVAILPEVAKTLGAKIWPSREFPRKIFKTKSLIEIPSDKIAQQGSADFIFYRKGESPFLFKLKFTADFVLGLGTPQMAEHMLRLQNLGSLVKIACSRYIEAQKILAKAKLVPLEFGQDANYNKQKLDLFSPDMKSH